MSAEQPRGYVASSLKPFVRMGYFLGGCGVIVAGCAAACAGVAWVNAQNIDPDWTDLFGTTD